MPSTFIDSLKKNANEKAELWHPQLTIRKINMPLSKSIEHPLLKEKRFSSFLELSNTEPKGNGLTFLSNTGNIANPSMDGQKMACQCRFVKDPSQASFIQTNQKVGSSNYQVANQYRRYMQYFFIDNITVIKLVNQQFLGIMLFWRI